MNYWIGNYLGLRVFQKRFPHLIKKEYIDRTYTYFEKYGGKTIFIARFIPVVRTFAPFLAGVGTMHYRRFLIYNVAGAIAWSVGVVLAGYLLGTIPFVQKNINLLVYGVIFVTIATVAVVIYMVGKETLGAPRRKRIKKSGRVADLQPLVIDSCADRDLETHGFQDRIDRLLVFLRDYRDRRADRGHPHEFKPGFAEPAHIVIYLETVVLDLGTLRSPEIDLPDHVARPSSGPTVRVPARGP